MMNKPTMISGANELTPASSGSISTTAATTAIDVEQLAEKVYQLLLADLRLAQARRGKISRHG